jgi:hypothetical protein
VLAGQLWLPGQSAAQSDPVAASQHGDVGMGQDGKPLLHATQRLDAAPTIAAVPTTRVIPGLNPTKVQAPPVVSRQQWGADESIRSNERQFAPIRKLIVHHSATENRPRNPAAIVREAYLYHVQGRGFGDIGYNYLIDHKGVIYEGRYSRRYASGEAITAEDHLGWGVVGAHAARMNAGSCGVCLLGNFELGTPTDAALSSLSWLMAWKAGRHRIDVLDSDPYENLSFDFFTFANLAGHRNVGFTQCPGSRLYAALPAVRAQAAAQAGRFDPLVVDIPGVTRTEFGVLGQGPLATTPGTTTPSTTTPGTTTSAAALGTGTKVIGYRALAAAGTVMCTSKVPRRGNAAGVAVGIGAPGVGDGYATITAAGVVSTFGGVAGVGDVAGRGRAADIAVTRSGQGYLVLMADGGIYPFGDARYFGSPKKSAVAAASLRIAIRSSSDGYWVLGSDGQVRNFGFAAALGSPAIAGTAVDIAATPSGKGYFVLMDSGEVAAFGDAVGKGGMASLNRRWAKPAAAITAMPSGGGYVISAQDGGLFDFGGASFLGSFAGSGTHVVGLVVACG